jgi:hypothetical protein
MPDSPYLPITYRPLPAIFIIRRFDGISKTIYWNDWTWILGEKYSPQSS